jgi:hypothetical protein
MAIPGQERRYLSKGAIQGELKRAREAHPEIEPVMVSDKANCTNLRHEKGMNRKAEHEN